MVHFFRGFRDGGKKLLVYLVFGSVLMVSILFPLSRASAADAWSVAAQALGVYAAYQSALRTLMAYGADPEQQVRNALADVQANGLDENENDIMAVDRVMRALTQKGNYVLKPNSLPFTWQVTGDNLFNASCYPTNYVSVNRGLVRVLHLNEDELAAVLGHEMTHGIRQHAAKDYAKAVAAYYGMSFLNMQYGLMDWNKLNGLAGYSIAKNITLPSEYEADAGGFRLMTDAGFNPGGPAAAMARMAYYMTYETRDTNEYEDPDKIGEDNLSDHPETRLREKRLADMMTAYGAGHVTVESGKTVCIDGRPLLTVDWTNYDYDNTKENAYLVAGGLAKAFHDNDTMEGWHFGTGESDYLMGIAVYQPLKAFVERTGRLETLRTLVADAYAGEAASGARTKMKTADEAQKADIGKIREGLRSLGEKDIRSIIERSDAYIDAGEPKRALELLSRVYPGNLVKKEADEAAALAVSGRAKAALGRYDEGLLDADKAVSLDAKTANLWMDRADARRMAGKLEGARADVEAAVALNAKNATAVYFLAEIYDEMNDRASALAWYRKYYKLRTASFRQIPQEYLKDISEKDWKVVEEEKANARKARETPKKEKAAGKSQVVSS